MEFSTTITGVLPFPPEKVFTYVADTRNDPNWAPFVASVEQVKGDGPGLGAVYKVGQKIPGRVIMMDYEVTRFEPHSALSWKSDKRSTRYTSDMTFEPTGSGTRIVQRNWVDDPKLKPPAGWIMKAMQPIFLKRQLRLLKKQLVAASA